MVGGVPTRCRGPERGVLLDGNDGQLLLEWDVKGEYNFNRRKRKARAFWAGSERGVGSEYYKSRGAEDQIMLNTPCLGSLLFFFLILTRGHAH